MCACRVACKRSGTHHKKNEEEVRTGTRRLLVGQARCSLLVDLDLLLALALVLALVLALALVLGGVPLPKAVLAVPVLFRARFLHARDPVW